MFEIRNDHVKSHLIDLSVVACILIFCVLLISITNIVFYKAGLIFTFFLPFVCGIFYESRRLNLEWNYMKWALFAYSIPFIVFSPIGISGLFDVYWIIISWWSIFFLWAYIWSLNDELDKKLIPLKTEANVVILSISYIYWLFDKGYTPSLNIYNVIVSLILFILPVFSFAYSLFNLTPTRNRRLALSIWSSIVLMILSINLAFNVIYYEMIEQEVFVNEYYNVLRFFLLGISILYISRNWLLISSYFPERGMFFNKAYFDEVKRNNIRHIIRFTKDKVSSKFVLAVAAITTMMYLINYFFELLPGLTFIYFVIWFIPLMYSLIYDINNYNNRRTVNF